MTNLKNSGSLVAIPWAFVLLVAFVGLLFVPSCEAKQDKPDLGARIIKWIIRKAVQSVPPAPRWLDCQRPLAGIGLPLVAPARTATATGRDVAGLVEGVIDTEQE